MFLAFFAESKSCTKSDAHHRKSFWFPFWQNTKRILYKIRREAPGDFCEGLVGQNTKDIVYKIRREAPGMLSWLPFCAKCKGDPLHNPGRSAGELFEGPLGKIQRTSYTKSGAKRRGTFWGPFVWNTKKLNRGSGAKHRKTFFGSPSEAGYPCI